MKLDGMLFGKHLEADEVLVRIIHRSWTVGVQRLFWPSCCFVAGLGLLLLAPVRLMMNLDIPWLLFCTLWWFQRFLDYYLDVWLITDHGVVALQWKGWFHRQSSRILYSDVQGVSYEIKGIVETLGKIGTLTIEKISTGGTFALADVHRPKDVESLIHRSMEAYLHKKNMKNAKDVQELLSTLVAEKAQERSVPVQQPAPAPTEKKRKPSIVTRRV